MIAAGFYIALNLEDWKVALEHKQRMLVTQEFKTKGRYGKVVIDITISLLHFQPLTGIKQFRLRKSLNRSCQLI